MASIGSWIPGVAINPILNAFIVQSPAVANGGNTGTFYSLVFCITNKSLAAADFLVGVWDAASVVVTTTTITVQASSSFIYNAGGPVAIPNGYTVRVQTVVALTGTISAAISMALESNY